MLCEHGETFLVFELTLSTSILYEKAVV